MRRELWMEDVYKRMHQAAYGPAHALKNENEAFRHLKQEWEQMGDPLPGEPLWEPVSRDGSVGRLHLRVYREEGGTLEDVYDAFLEGARIFQPKPERFSAEWTGYGEKLAKKADGPLTYGEWQRVDGMLRGRKYPAISHSEPYRAAYQPCYRVIPFVVVERLFRE